MPLNEKKVCIFLPSLAHGGAERRMTLLAVKLKERGCHVEVLVLRKQGEFTSLLDAAGIPIRSVDKKGRLDLLGAVMRTKAIFSDNYYDVVLSCLPSANVFAVLVKLVNKKTPLIWGIAAADMPMDDYGVWAKLGDEIQKRLAYFADKIIVNSFKAYEISVSKGFDAAKLYVIQNGVDTEKFDLNQSAGQAWRQQNGIPLDAKVIAIVARLDPAKGIETFLGAVDIVESRHREFDITAHGFSKVSKPVEPPKAYYLMFGSAHSEYANTLKADIQAHALYGERLFLFESVQVDHTIYNAVDMVSITSVSESFPNVMLEAMASGSRLVSTDVGDCRRVIKHYGDVVAVSDSVALADVWQSFQGSEDSAFSSVQVREYIVNEFSIDRMVSKFEALLLDMLSGKSTNQSRLK